MLIQDIFEKDINRPINPVVYFQEKDPQKIANEISEYVITGGYPKNDPRHNEDGIHEQFVRLLSGIAGELRRGDEIDHPACWISGYYGSGKSSFAKFIGLSLNNLTLPSGEPLHEALLKQNPPSSRVELGNAWEELIGQFDESLAVVFDIGTEAQDNDHIHTVIVRECQKALGYCPTSPEVADQEVRLEADGDYEDFLACFQELYEKPWEELKSKRKARDMFSAALFKMAPQTYGSPTAWIVAHRGASQSYSAGDAVSVITQMLDKRRSKATLFLVVDEVSQYIHEDADRMLKLQSFVADLRKNLKGRVWLLATGQQKLEEGAVTVNLSKLKDRFPAHLRVHLSSANIREVIHQRLLKKRETVLEQLRELYQDNQADLNLNAYEGAHLGKSEFTEVYPLLPGHIELFMQITTGLHARSNRAQGDNHAIRGLIQLLVDMFKVQELGRLEVGTLITIDRVYDVLHTALDGDVQMTLGRALAFCKKAPKKELGDPELAARVLKAISLLELIQDDNLKRDVDLINRCLYQRIGQGSQRDEIQQAIDVLRAKSFLGSSDKTGYKIQSSAGEEWNKERDTLPVSMSEISAEIQQSLRQAVGNTGQSMLGTMPLPWSIQFGDTQGAATSTIKRENSPTCLHLDLRYVRAGEAAAEHWVPESRSSLFKNKLIWVVGDHEAPQMAAIEVAKSDQMVRNQSMMESTLSPEKSRLLVEERNRLDAERKKLLKLTEKTFLEGTFYFQGKSFRASDYGGSFALSLKAMGDLSAPQLYPHPVTYRPTVKDMEYFIESADLIAPPGILDEDKLGLLSEEAGKYEASCAGKVPRDVLGYIEEHKGVTGGVLLTEFGGPPFGYGGEVIRAVLLGLLRGHKVRALLKSGSELTSSRDSGARELLKEQGLRNAKFFPQGAPPVGGREKIAMCKLFEDFFHVDVARDEDAIADAVMNYFGVIREELNEAEQRLTRLPGKPEVEALRILASALELCRRDRRKIPTTVALRDHLSDIRDGINVMRILATELTDEHVAVLRAAHEFSEYFREQLMNELRLAGGVPTSVEEASELIVSALESPSPWLHTDGLAEAVETLRTEYENARRTILVGHGQEVENAVQAMKRREGFESLDQEQQHQVLRCFREMAAARTTEGAAEPKLSHLREQLPVRLQQAKAEALERFDDIREDNDGVPIVPVPLRAPSTELKTEAELEAYLSRIREAVLRELQAGRHVRLK